MKTRIAIKKAIFAATLLCVISSNATAAPTQSSAEALIARAEQALHSANSLQADFEEIDTYPSRYKDLAQRGTVTLARPGRLHIHVSRFRRVSAGDPWSPSGNDILENSDGATYTYAFLHPYSTQVRKEASTPKNLLSAVKLLPLAAAFFAPASKELPGQSGPATLQAGIVWEGGQYRVVQYPVESGENGQSIARAFIGADGLVHRLVYTTQTHRGEVVEEWALRHIVLGHPIPADKFAYAPPKEATIFSHDGRSTLLAAGTDAPDFTVLDRQGRPVKLSDYRGKTVVLDFWATWCWPCNQSLPHIESVVQADRSQGVVVLAVAIWDSKTGFDRWVARHNYPDIDFAIDSRPEGQDVASTLYHVGTTPTAYVIGPNGKIVRAIAGFTGPTDELASAIAAANPVKSARAGQ